MPFASIYALRRAMRPSPAAWGVFLLCAQLGHGAQAQAYAGDEGERLELKLDVSGLGRAGAGQTAQTAQLVHLEADSLEGAVGESVVLRGASGTLRRISSEHLTSKWL